MRSSASISFQAETVNASPISIAPIVLIDGKAVLGASLDKPADLTMWGDI